MDKTENPELENLDNNQDDHLDESFTIKEVANFIDETPNVVRNWFKELRDYIPHEKNSSGYNVYRKDGIERFKEIKALHRQQGWSMRQIGHYFATGGESFKPEPEKSAGELLAEEIRGLREEISALRQENKEIKEHLANQEKFNLSLMERLQQAERGTIERDRLLMESLNETREAKKLMAATNERLDKNLDDKPDNGSPEQKKGFFARLFGM
ncbi:MerR family transcriptional regulator [Bacillus thermotolerans]|uniref:MerR family transcriptional regulator n=1 Tax=Bacillus thermotolerans TaxID=1221996 RepID=UPI00058362D2|nr:MerR family transcriptional regulator [Bacillus thermotolerans]KKB34581.1 hypothetical protein QY97_02230 [Bacillus thermotolerans]